MNHFDKIYLIERYHQHKLTAHEQAEFDMLVQTDADFAAEVEDYGFLFGGFEMLHLESFQEQLQGFESRAKNSEAATPAVAAQKSSQPAPMRVQKGGAWYTRWRNVAAGVAFLIFAPLAYLALQQPSPAALAEGFFEPSNAVVLTTRARDSSAISAQQTAAAEVISTYNRHDYKAALPQLLDYAQRFGSSPQVELYIGICYFAQHDNQKAIEYLTRVSQNTDSNARDPRQEAEYTLALAYIREKNAPKALEILQNITTQKYHNFKESALKLQKALQK